MNKIHTLSLLALSLLALALLAGCGGGSSDSATPVNDNRINDGVLEPLALQYQGVWAIDDLAYVLITQDTVTTFAYDDTRGCYESGLFTVRTSTANSMTSRDVYSGEITESSFARDGEALLITEGNDTLAFLEPNFFDPYPGCESLHNITNIQLDVELAYLPPEITINRSAQDSGYTEYRYEVTFDINESGSNDAGDVAIVVLHYKSTSTYPENYVTTIEELGAGIWYIIPKQGTDSLVSSTVSTAHNTVAFSQVDNQLSFNFDISQNPLFAHINEGTPIQVTAHLSYPEPEVTVIDSWADGPWNWSSDLHTDVIPEEGFVRPNTFVDQLIDDPTGDHMRGESMWVDITSVKLTYNN